MEYILKGVNGEVKQTIYQSKRLDAVIKYAEEKITPAMFGVYEHFLVVNEKDETLLWTMSLSHHIGEWEFEDISQRYKSTLERAIEQIEVWKGDAYLAPCEECPDGDEVYQALETIKRLI